MISPTDKLVGNLILLLDQEDPQLVQFAVDSLELLERDAIPAIVCRLDDRRKMRVRPILLLNRGPHFELYRQYAPEQVVDCLIAIVGAPHGADRECALENGGTDDQRDSCVASWKRSVEDSRHR